MFLKHVFCQIVSSYENNETKIPSKAKATSPRTLTHLVTILAETGSEALAPDTAFQGVVLCLTRLVSTEHGHVCGPWCRTHWQGWWLGGCGPQCDCTAQRMPEPPVGNHTEWTGQVSAQQS